MTGAVRFVLFVFIVCRFESGMAAYKAETHPATEFTKHALIQPRIYHGTEKIQISSTKEESGRHAHHITVDYDLEDKKYILDLQLNRDLIPKGYFQRYQKEGKDVVNKPTEEEIELCHYKGIVRGIPDSWVALSTCNDTLRGVVFDGSDMHYIENTANDIHYLYRHSDIAPNNKIRGYHGDSNDEHHHITEDHEFNRTLRYKRSSEPIVRGPYNANKQSRYVELVLVVDNGIYRELGDIKRVEQYSKAIANIVNGLYSPLNIYIALVGVVIWTEHDQIDFSPDGEITLKRFLDYRRQKLIKEHPNDNAQLLTNFPFDKGVVGNAFPKSMCSYNNSGGINKNHSSVGQYAALIAHEMGHSLGMAHDTNTSECECPEKRCIMAPAVSSVPPIHWSSCSWKYLKQAFELGIDYCLRNKPVALFDSPVCGNGFVESGEQCDCGLPDNCDNTCCNATTCMLHKNASCATGECCDLSTCKPKNAGTLCRSADYECDLPEYCTGQSEYCPDDIYKMDAEICDDGKAYCYHGFCRTRSDQCKLLWGNNIKSSEDECYKKNTDGTHWGSCGYNQFNQTYSRCQDEHVLCGMLQCDDSSNGELKFGKYALPARSYAIFRSQQIACRTANIDLGINQVDPGLVPNGAKCGDGKMCVNKKCMSVDSFRVKAGSCPNDCSGNGVCNSLGHCHCKTGFAPPLCDIPGPGGSSDSGPATDPNAHTASVTAKVTTPLYDSPGPGGSSVSGPATDPNAHTASVTAKVTTPLYDSPGPGGSSDSGPATDPNAHTASVTAKVTTPLYDSPGPGGSSDSGSATDPNAHTASVTATVTTPLYASPGPGGSSDSGPAIEPIAHTEFVTAMLIFFLGVIPGFILLAFVACYIQRNLKFRWKKSPSTTKCSNLDSVSTISQHVPDRYSGSLRNHEIKKTDLISTTNTDKINNSSNINPPCTSNRYRFSLNNFKGLKVNTNIKCSKSEDPIPQTSETVCFDDVGSVSVGNLKKYFEQNYS